mmetsp:Transcript_20331/g.32313  ORF Transcript_20331/g.32313 Transcript_20331/m.32313 type:complete len:217 (+) Transcript_20331:666-1316(+)
MMLRMLMMQRRSAFLLTLVILSLLFIASMRGKLWNLIQTDKILQQIIHLNLFPALKYQIKHITQKRQQILAFHLHQIRQHFIDLIVILFLFLFHLLLSTICIHLLLILYITLNICRYIGHTSSPFILDRLRLLLRRRRRGHRLFFVAAVFALSFLFPLLLRRSSLSQRDGIPALLVHDEMMMRAHAELPDTIHRRLNGVDQDIFAVAHHRIRDKLA